MIPGKLEGIHRGIRVQQQQEEVVQALQVYHLHQTGVQVVPEQHIMVVSEVEVLSEQPDRRAMVVAVAVVQVVQMVLEASVVMVLDLQQLEALLVVAAVEAVVEQLAVMQLQELAALEVTALQARVEDQVTKAV